MNKHKPLDSSYWKECHKLNKDYLKYKHVKKLSIVDMFEFKFAMLYFFSTLLLIASTITLIVNSACPVLPIMTGILSTIPAAVCAVSIKKSVKYITIKVPLTEAEKILSKNILGE